MQQLMLTELSFACSNASSTSVHHACMQSQADVAVVYVLTEEMQGCNMLHDAVHNAGCCACLLSVSL